MGAPDTKIRLGGLTSGFDTETIIKQLLSVEQAKIDSLTEEKEINATKIDTWKDIADNLKDFGRVVQKLKADITTTLFTAKTVSSTASTVATASAKATAESANYSLGVTTVARAPVAYGTQQADAYTLPGSGTVVLNGASISLTAGDNLDAIATKISNASYTSGNELLAMVIDNQLVLQTKATGSSQSIYGTTAGAPPFILATDDANNILRGELGLITAGGNLNNVAQTAADAAYTINGVPATSESNTVTDAVTGVTFELISTGSTTLGVKVDTDNIKETLSDFITQYNDIREDIDRIRNVVLDEDEAFGMFFSDSMMRDIFNEMRRLGSGGVRMGDDEWNGSVTMKNAASVGDTSFDLQSFATATGTLKEGDEFTIAGDSTIYRLKANASKALNEATVVIQPPLKVAVSGGEAIRVAMRTIEDFGIGTRTDSYSGLDGVLGVIDQGKLDLALSGDLDLIKNVFSRTGDSKTQEGVGTRLYDWVDVYTKISATTSSQQKRLIDDVKLTNLEGANEDIDAQVKRLEERMAKREELLIRQFSNMENAMARAQSAGQAVQSLNGGGGAQ